MQILALVALVVFMGTLGFGGVWLIKRREELHERRLKPLMAARQQAKEGESRRLDTYYDLKAILQNADDGSEQQARAIEAIGRLEMSRKELEWLMPHEDYFHRTEKPILKQAVLDLMLIRTVRPSH